jgi:hypothetical protein
MVLHQMCTGARDLVADEDDPHPPS